MGACSAASPSREISAGQLARHVRVLASDAYEGREPGTQGERLTLAYIAQAFAQAGLEPAGPGGSWYQPVPLARVAPAAASLTLAGTPVQGGVALASERPLARVELPPAPVVFVGYGLSEPALGRDDLAGVDLAGKVALFLPGLPPGASAALWGSAGSFTSKLQDLERKGAAAALAVYPVDTSAQLWAEAAGYFAHERWLLGEPTRSSMITGALANEATRALLAQVRLDWAGLQARAEVPGFRPLELGPAMGLALANRVDRLTSHNVVARLPGATRAHEHVLFTAHWDGLGRCAPQERDPICNGAVDNASGIAGLIELARTFAAAPRPERSLLFVATTAEERGLLGAHWFARRPPVPLAGIVGGLNFDVIAGRPSEAVVLLGQGLTDLDPLVARAAASMGRRVVRAPDLQPFFRRSDTYAFAQAGVPLLAASGMLADRAGFERFMRSRYHKPSDEYSMLMDLRGAAQDVELARRFGSMLANTPERPGWRPGRNPAQPGGGQAPGASL